MKYKDDIILNVNQFLDEEVNVIIGNIEVNVLSDDLVDEAVELVTVTELGFSLYNMSVIDNIAELGFITADMSEEENYVMETLQAAGQVLTNDHLVMVVTEFEWIDEYNTLTYKLNLAKKLINYCLVNRYDYLVIMIDKEVSLGKKASNVTEFPKIKQYEALGFERINNHQTPVMVKNINGK